MPKLTNRLNLPAPLVAALTSWYRGDPDADMSVTGLLQPPRKVELERQHAEDVEEDAIDRIWSVLGSATHAMVERAQDHIPNPHQWLFEHRVTTEIAGWKISGQADWFDTVSGTIFDLKVTSAWSVVYEKTEYLDQLNCYAHLMRADGYDVKAVANVLILRDWVKSKAGSGRYPEAQVVVKDQKLWDPAKAASFMIERVQLHQNARKALPECSDDDRWRGWDKQAKVEVFRRCGTGNNDGYCNAYPFCAQGKGA